MTSGKRFACLWFPNWPIQRLESADSRLRMLPLVLFEQRAHRGDFVTHLNERAARLGIRAGMPVSEARTYAAPRNHYGSRASGQAMFFPVDPPRDRVALEHLVPVAQGFSPMIGLADEAEPDSLLIDLTGVAHLYGGEANWGASVRTCFHKLGYRLGIGIAETIGAAWGAARARSGKTLTVIPEGELHRLHALPIAALRLTDRALSIFQRLGIERIKQVLLLDSKSIVSRLGRDVAVRIAQFLGEAPESVTPFVPSPVYREVRQFEHPMTDPKWAEQMSLSMLKRLLHALAEREQGLIQLEIQWRGDRGQQTVWTLELGRPTLDEALLSELCQMKWERQQFSFPVEAIVLEARQLGPLRLHAQSLFDERQLASQRELEALTVRLSARIGAENVSHFELLPDAVPEYQVRRVPVVKVATTPLTTWVQEGSLQFGERPLFLLATPLPVDVLSTNSEARPLTVRCAGRSFELREVEGPERIESAWWRHPVRRDYYRVQLVTGQRWWMFQQLASQQWFLHGEIL